MLLQLSPLIRRQARWLCRNMPDLVDDAYSEGCLRLHELLEQGIEEVPYLMAAARNRMRNFLRDERRAARPDLRYTSTAYAEEEPGAPFLDQVPDPHPEDPVERLTVTGILESLPPTARRALVKRAFHCEPLSGAERIALYRLRKEIASGSRSWPW